MPPRCLLVSSHGGHLTELHVLATSNLAVRQRMWVTFDSLQTRSLLCGEDLHLIEEIPPRGGAAALTALPAALSLLRRTRPDMVVSTGAAVALPYLTAARVLGIPAHYIESATRSDKPSLTGRLLQLVPGLQLHQQEGARTWSGRWQRSGSVYDGFTATDTGYRPSHPLRVLVLVGTMRFPFPRLVEQVLAAASESGPEWNIVWQAGHTPVPPDSGHVHEFLRNEDLVREAWLADVIVTHAGVGSTLLALTSGKCPVLVPRTMRLGEHVDDHQPSLAAALSARGLAVAPAEVSREACLEAAAMEVALVRSGFGPLRQASSADAAGSRPQDEVPGAIGP